MVAGKNLLSDHEWWEMVGNGSRFKEQEASRLYIISAATGLMYIL